MKVCEVDGCQREHAARGYCDKHYRKARSIGEFTDIRPKGRAGCVVEECERDHYAKGYCHRHYANFYRSGNPLPLRSERSTCEVTSCEEKHVAEGLCRRHYDFRRNSGYDLRQMPELLYHIGALERYGLKVVSGKAYQGKGVA